MDIILYETIIPIEKCVCNLIAKIYPSPDKILVLTQDLVSEQNLDTILWTHDRTRFIPHGSSVDEVNYELQPIFFTHQYNNWNKAEILIVSDPWESFDFLFIKNLKKNLIILPQTNQGTKNSLLHQIKSQELSCHMYVQNHDLSWS